MKRFSPSIPSAWRNAKRLLIPTHAELVERVAVLTERVARQNVRLGRLKQKIVRWSAVLLINKPNLDDLTPDGRGYMIPRAVVAHPAEADLAGLERLKVEPVVYQNLVPEEVFAPHPTPVSEGAWVLEGWRNANGECWWSPQKGPAHWRMVNPTFVQAGWLLPHYAIPVIPSSEGGQR